MSQKTLQLEGLKAFIDQQNSRGAKEYIDNVVNFFDCPLTAVELGLAFEQLFCTDNGTVAFLKKSIQANKLFKESNINIFTLWHNLLKIHCSSLDFSPYASDIVECCMRFIASSVAASAKERERATMVLQILFQNKVVNEHLTREVLQIVLNIIHLKKPTELFAYQVFKLMGIIARFYPASVSEESAQRMKVECFKAMDNVINQQEAGFKTLAGVMECLKNYLINFAPSPDDEPEECDRIYVCTKKLSSLADDIKQKIAFRAAIDLFTDHSTLFATQIYRDFKYWHVCLEKWLASDVYNYRQRGIYGSYAFHKVMAEKLKADEENCKDTLHFILIGFRSVLESVDSKPHRTGVAIRGFGTMSQLCNRYCPEIFTDLLTSVLQRCEFILMADDKEMRDILDHFADYILALSTVINEIEEPQVSNVIIESLKSIMIRLIRDFHFLPTSHSSIVASSMCNALYDVYLTDVTLLERLLSKVIFDGVVWTCSHKHIFDANADWAENIDWKNNLTIKSYTQLWHALLDEEDPRSLIKSLIVDKICDHLILTLFKILEKLDFRTKKRVYTGEDGTVQEFNFCDPNFDLCPVRPKDFHIFINVVDFYRDIWYKFRRQNTLNWIEEFCERMVKFSLRNPQVSGFPKLLLFGVITAKKLKVFTNKTAPNLEVTLAHALKIMIVKCQRVSGELQMSIIELVLQYPVKFYNNCLIEMIPIFETALDLGKSMTWLANLAIHCLEKIASQNNSDDLRKLYAKVLPLLDTYLQGHCSIEYLSIREGRGGNKLRKSGPPKKTPLEFHDIQANIVSLLGKLQPEAASLLVLNSMKAENLVKWDSEKCIRLNLKLPDINPIIYLDALVQRICHLALSSTDRQTKIAACEVVHGLILYLIGARAHKGQMWTELCNRILILGCDGDETVQQIFEPLLMQVMHFMSKYENLDRGVEEMMNALMNGISSKSNFGLRDLSASCLREFVEWSIKQTTPQQLAASPVSIEIILGRLKMYSFDSDASKRVGAALAFNNLYRLLREEEAICDIFFVDLLHTFCVSLKLSEELTTLPPNDDNNSDLQMISDALDHIVKVLTERNDLYNKTSNRRLVPSALNSGTLEDILKFLIFEAGSRKIYYRHKCMQLARTLAPKLTGIENLSSFFQSRSIGDDRLREICEGLPDGCGILARPEITFLSLAHSETPAKVLYTWLENLLGSLECYTWLLQEKAITNDKQFFTGTNILRVIPYYLNNICWETLPNIVNVPSFNASPGSTEVSDNLNVLKCLIAMSIVDFLTEFISSGCAVEENVEFWNTTTSRSVCKLILQMIFEPDKLHLDFRLEKVLKQLNTRIDMFCSEVKNDSASTQFVMLLNRSVLDALVDRLKLLSDKMVDLFKDSGTTTVTSDYMDGIHYIVKTTNFTQIDAATRAALQKTSKKIVKTSFDGIKRISFGTTIVATQTESVKRFATSLVRIAFEMRDYSIKLIDFLLDGTELSTAIMDSRIRHGWLYFEMYQTAICQKVKRSFFEKMFILYPTRSEAKQSYMLRILKEILSYKHKSSRSIKSIADLCVENLPILLEHSTDKMDDYFLIDYLTILSVISTSNSISIKTKVPLMENWITGKLRSLQLNLENKCKIISLLPILLDVTDYINVPVMSALEDLQCRHFPLRSNEFPKNSIDEFGLKYAFITLLNSLVASKSYVILEFLFKCTSYDEKHLVEDIITKELKSFALCLTDDQQVEVLYRTFNTVLNERYEPTIRLTIFRRFLLNIFVNCNDQALVEYFTKVIKRINLLVEADYRMGSRSRGVQQALVNRIVGYTLLEYFFGTVRKEFYWSTTCPVAVELLVKPKTESELVGTFTKKAFYVRSEVFSTEDKEARELFRQYQCAAYRALCSLVSNTQTELKFYSKFLFEENTRKGEVIWARLVDCSPDKHYVFPGQEMEVYAKIKKRFIAIRQLDVRPNVSLKTMASSKRLQTQNIMESSLSDDVTDVDMTSHSVRPPADALKRHEIRSSEVLTIRLECNDLNDHEVMPMLCGVVKFMYNNNITPVITDITIKRSYPWVLAIANSIGDCENHRNIRVFLAQVVDNCSEVFQQFAHVLFKPILKMLVDECAGNSLNFFITDMVALLITWSSKKLHNPQEPDEVALIHDLIKFMLKSAWSEQKMVLKFNLEIVQTMLSVWKDIIKAPSNLLLDMITRTQRNDSNANKSGLVFLAMMLSNELIPWTETNKVLYINALLLNLKNDSASVYQLAANALGMSLVALKDSGDDASFENLSTEIRMHLQSLNSKKDRQSEKRFREIIYNVHYGSPHIVDDLREIICFKIPTAIGTTKRNYLEMILSRIELFGEEDIYNTIIGIGLKDLLKHSEYQLLGLHILNRSLPMLLNYHDITSLFELVEESLNLQQTDCRDIAYEVCIYVAQYFTDELKEKAIKLLLKGISDPDVEIQKRIYQFWSKEANMSPKISERLIYLLRKYATDGERHFLGLCTQLILDPAIESSESKKQIFEFEDDRDAKLHEYQINTKSRIRTTSTLPPLFAESQQTRLSLFKASQLCSLVRDTNADYVFEPTQDPQIITQAKENFTLQSQNSMPFQIATQVLNRRSERVASENGNESSSHQLRRRFLKDTEKEKKETAEKVISSRQKAAEQTAQKAKDNNVSLYRRYRFGEYPDLLINNLAFLLPLQALARRDLLVAKQLFVAIFTAILEAEESDSAEFLKQIDEIFQQVLCNSPTCESTIFSAFLEVSLLKPSAFNLPADKVANVAKMTKNLTIGALYLENRLNADWEQELSETLEPQHWLQLADIYSSLKEYEVVSAIFSDKLRTDPRLAEAIELRANGRADDAQELLIEVIGANRHVEHYYAYNCYYECAMELSNWSHLTEAINNEIDDPEELWTDNYNLNFLLPNHLHANLQLLLEGDHEGREFLKIIEQWMMVPDKAEYMKNEFCEELMMLWVANKNFRQCRVLYENFLKKFLREWSVTSSLCAKTKLDSLLRAQRVAEIDQYAQQFLNGFDKKCAKQICRRWNSCVIDPTESLRLWNTVVGYRKYVAALGVKTLQDAHIENPPKCLTKSIYNMTLQLFNAAEHQKNVALAQKVYERLTPNTLDREEVLAHELCRIKKIFIQTYQQTNCISFIEASWKAISCLLVSPAILEYPEKHVETLGLKSAIAIGIVDKIDYQLMDEEADLTLRSLIHNPTTNIKVEILRIALEALQTKVTIASELPSKDSKILANSLYTLAQFSYDCINRNDLGDYEKIFINSVLQGMRYGSKEANQLFPCIFQLPAIESGELKNYFERQSADVPVAAYLAWIPQILSRLQLTEPCYLDDVVQRIAVEHPEALRYPFAIWHKQAMLELSLRTNIENYTDRQKIEEILVNLQHKLRDKFTKSFRYLAIPEAYLLSQLESFDRDIRNHSNITDVQFTYLIENLLKDVYCEEEGVQGVAYRRLLQYKEGLEEIKDMSFALHEKRIRRTLQDITQSLRKHLSEIENSVRLETLCPWLAKYQWCGEEECIELPGQYEQNSLEIEPKAMEHIKIVRFNSNVRVLVSQRYPLRIAIQGSNGRSYDFLVKHGEDLKQDQRVQQILQLMSQKLHEDKRCQSHNLYIRTYQVVPIDRTCGLLSWVEDTVSLHDFILNSFGRHCPNSTEIVNTTVRSYLEFIRRPSHASPDVGNLVVYGMAASRYTREQLIQNLRALENRVDHDIVKTALMDLATSPGSFFALRNNFATTLAAMNVAHWILGVGDRHLQNTLISVKNGSVTGIDFGFTFGSGTRDQKVPELTPFRLTPHLVNLMAPMGTSGLIFKCMVHALRVLRNADRILLACMEVFIREPSVSWLHMPWGLSRWEQKDRIDIARCKLQGSNPMHLFERELNAGVISENSEYLEGYVRILRGHLQFNIRSRLPKEDLSVEDQVRSLIDQATDPAVLGISYVGFTPWM